MRDIVLLIVLCGVVPLAFVRPWLGALAWVWISLMNPHRLAYGFMYEAPVAQVVAGATLLGLLISNDKRSLPWAPPVVWTILFTGWMVLTFPFSLVATPENWEQLSKVLKIMGFNLVVAIPLYTRRHIDWLITVMVLSISFFGVKGGIFALATGGQYQVRGGGGFIEPNNELALALVMVIPLTYYLAERARRRSVRWLLFATIFFSSVAAIASQSRGALIAILAMAAAALLRGTSRLKLVVPVVAVGLFIAAFMPSTWWSRMETIQSYDSDASAMGRVNAWTVAWRVATSHFFGGGFSLEAPEVFDRYAPDPTFIAVAHSVYFQVLGQHGFIGLFLYLAIWVATFRTCHWIIKNSDQIADKQFARMAEVSLIGFFVGGAFLSLAYFDGPYYIMVALVVLRYKVLGNQRAAVSGLVPAGGAAG